MFYLGNGWLEDSRLLVVPDHSLVEIEAVVLELGVLRLGLAAVVVRAQLGHQVGRVLGGVDGQGLGDHQQRLGKLGDGQLFPRNNDNITVTCRLTL